MEQPKIVIGLAGKFCSGKGSVAEYLVEKYGFKSSSFSDRIREEILSRGQEITRESLQEVAGQMRQQFGPEVLAARTLEKVTSEGAQKAVIETLRSVEEVEYLRKTPNFVLINVYSDPEVRLERMKARKREQDPQTLGEFIAAEERDLKKDGRSMEECIAMADNTIENNGTTEELHQKIDDLLQKIGL